MSFLLIFLVLIGCHNTFGTDSDKEDDDVLGYIETVRFSVEVSVPNSIGKADDWGMLILPEAYSKKGESTRLIIYCHGGGITVNNIESPIEYDDFVIYFVSRGFAVLAMAGMPEEYANDIGIGNTRNMGHPIGLAAYSEGYRYTIENYNINKSGCFLYALSHGGLIASNIVNFSDIPVIAETGLAPLLSIEKNAWFLMIPEYRPSIIRLYNMNAIESPEEAQGAVYEKGKVGVYDPYDYLLNQVETPYKVPFMIIASNYDASVDYWIIDDFAKTLNQRGSNIIVYDAGEIGVHNVSASPVYVGEFSYKGTTMQLHKTVFDAYNFFISCLNNGN
jgi:hypothetical protein